MKIKSVSIKNFRGYKHKTEIHIDDFTVFVGKNDVGKSTILEALDVFFNLGDKSSIIKMDKDDVNVSNLLNGDSESEIGVTFTDLPEKITIDETNPTTLSAEHLLNIDGDLEIIKVYPNGGKEQVFIMANHPTNDNCKDLLLKRQKELQKIVSDNNIYCTNKNINALLRRSIWNHYSDSLAIDEIRIEIKKIEEKNIWTKINEYMPLYALFQSDRSNCDGDSEIQDPMKLAVKEILSKPNIIEKLDEVAKQVEGKLTGIANNTLNKLKEMNPEIANKLKPNIPTSDSLKWDTVFRSLTISGDEGIPFNKRGSGVKRLVLINFFRAEAERRKNERNVPDTIYAIEEPETSQHPDHQRKLINALRELALTENSQVLLTTHSPSVVKELGFSSIRLLEKTEDSIMVECVEPSALSSTSLDEVNYLVFDVVPEEYHSELYEQLKSLYDERERTESKIKEFDKNFFHREKGVPLSYPCRNYNNSTTIHTFVRNQIHHRADNGVATEQNLKVSIDEMREYILGWT